MTPKAIKVYLKIIHELLTCPNGEEWIRLKRYENWVNADLIQVMEQVVAQLTQGGNQEAATFLHNWAAKLHHILLKEPAPAPTPGPHTEAYQALIEALLSGEDEDSLLAEHQDLIGPGLVQVINQRAQSLEQQGALESALYLKSLAARLNQLWIQFHEFQPELDKSSGLTPSGAATAKDLHNQVYGAVKDFQAGQASPVLVESPAPVQPLERVVGQLTDCLTQLSQVLARLASSPIAYMEALERAASENWLLTTEEVEQLIGVRPKCHGTETSYQRGIWTFVKVGKIGSQIAWRVAKQALDELPQIGTDVGDASPPGIPRQLASPSLISPSDDAVTDSLHFMPNKTSPDKKISEKSHSNGRRSHQHSKVTVPADLSGSLDDVWES